jgi:hypothetical protein
MEKFAGHMLTSLVSWRLETVKVISYTLDPELTVIASHRTLVDSEPPPLATTLSLPIFSVKVRLIPSADSEPGSYTAPCVAIPDHEAQFRFRQFSWHQGRISWVPFHATRLELTVSEAPGLSRVRISRTRIHFWRSPLFCLCKRDPRVDARISPPSVHRATVPREL